MTKKNAGICTNYAQNATKIKTLSFTPDVGASHDRLAHEFGAEMRRFSSQKIWIFLTFWIFALAIA